MSIVDITLCDVDLAGDTVDSGRAEWDTSLGSCKGRSGRTRRHFAWSSDGDLTDFCTDGLVITLSESVKHHGALETDDPFLAIDHFFDGRALFAEEGLDVISCQ